MKRNRAVVAVAVVTFGAWLSPACGGDSESDGDKKTGGTGGTGGTEAGTGGSSGGDATTDSKPDTSSEGGKCKDSDCPGLGSIVAGCCKADDTCGYDGNAIGMGCVSQEEITKLLEGGLDAQVPTDAADPNCDDFTVAGIKLEGCCPSTGFCGVFEPFLTKQCYDWNALPSQVPKPDNIVVKPCGPGAGDSSSDVSSEAATDAGAG